MPGQYRVIAKLTKIEISYLCSQKTLFQLILSTFLHLQIYDFLNIWFKEKSVMKNLDVTPAKIKTKPRG